MTRVVTKLKLFSQKKYTGYSLMMVKNLRDDRKTHKGCVRVILKNDYF